MNAYHGEATHGKHGLLRGRGQSVYPDALIAFRQLFFTAEEPAAAPGFEQHSAVVSEAFVDEGYDFSSGANVARLKMRLVFSTSDAVLDGPKDSFVIVLTLFDITKRVTRAFRLGRIGEPPEESNNLSPRTGLAYAKSDAAGPGCETSLKGPTDGSPVILRIAHIDKGRLLNGGVLPSGSPPQEGHHLLTGAFLIRRKLMLTCARSYVVFDRPQDGFVVVLAFGHIFESESLSVGRILVVAGNLRRGVADNVRNSRGDLRIRDFPAVVDPSSVVSFSQDKLFLVMLVF